MKRWPTNQNLPNACTLTGGGTNKLPSLNDSADSDGPYPEYYNYRNAPPTNNPLARWRTQNNLATADPDLARRGYGRTRGYNFAGPKPDAVARLNAITNNQASPRASPRNRTPNRPASANAAANSYSDAYSLNNSWFSPKRSPRARTPNRTASANDAGNSYSDAYSLNNSWFSPKQQQQQSASPANNGQQDLRARRGLPPLTVGGDQTFDRGGNSASPQSQGGSAGGASNASGSGTGSGVDRDGAVNRSIMSEPDSDLDASYDQFSPWFYSSQIEEDVFEVDDDYPDPDDPDAYTPSRAYPYGGERGFMYQVIDYTTASWEAFKESIEEELKAMAVEIMKRKMKEKHLNAESIKKLCDENILPMMRRKLQDMVKRKVNSNIPEKARETLAKMAEEGSTFACRSACYCVRAENNTNGGTCSLNGGGAAGSPTSPAPNSPYQSPQGNTSQGGNTTGGTYGRSASLM